MEKESFIIHTDDMECVDTLSDEQAGRLFKALLRYSKSGAAPKLSGSELMAFMFMKKQLDRDREKYIEICEKRRLAGLKGGRPKKNDLKEEAKAFLKNQNKPNKADSDSETETETENETENVTDSDGKKREKEKKAYGLYGNVLLTDSELEIIKTEFENDYQKRINRLSEYIEQTGKSYKSHLATLRVWARNEAEREERARDDGTAFSDNSYDSKALELLTRKR